MLADVLVSSDWRTGDVPAVESPRRHLTLVPSSGVTQVPIYRWRRGRYGVTLTRDEATWIVRLTSTGRLFGPTETLYEERHTDERYACWDVMARVIRATQDEDEGLKAGRDAAAWVATTFVGEVAAHA
jgi:hypothetical protein